MDQTADHLTGKNEGEVSLERLKELTDEHKKLEQEYKDLEEQAKEKKAQFNRISQEEIPSLLSEGGLSEIKLVTGEKVIVKEGISVTITDQDSFKDFLESRDETDIIKINLAFDKMEEERKKALFNFLMENDYMFDTKEGVNHMTQTAYFKRLLGIGKEPEDIQEGLETGTMVPRESIDGFSKVFTYYTTKIK